MVWVDVEFVVQNAEELSCLEGKKRRKARTDESLEGSALCCVAIIINVIILSATSDHHIPFANAVRTACLGLESSHEDLVSFRLYHHVSTYIV